MSADNTIKLSHLDSQVNFQDFLESAILVQRPGSTLVWIGISPSLLADCKYPEDKYQFFVNDFYSNNFYRYTVKTLIKTNIHDLVNWIENNMHRIENRSEFCKIALIKRNETVLRTDLNQIKNWISDNHLQKLVAVTKSNYKFTNNIHPISQIRKLTNLNGSLYGSWKNGIGFLGVSPEPLFVKENKYWLTRALAGTIDTSILNFKDLLLNDNKEVNEHQYVIFDIKNKLKNITSIVSVGKIDVIEFGALAHLCSDIKFQNPRNDAQELIKLLSPTAALGGYSLEQQDVLKLLRQLEYFKNEGESRLFGGTIGFTDGFTDGFSSSSNECKECFGLVSIRNIYWKENLCEIHSGCGVVEESNIEKEIVEISNKCSSIERIFT